MHGLKADEVAALTGPQREGVLARRSELEWVAVDGVLRPISIAYGRLIDDYLEDELEDFDSATTDWMNP
jgi:hypothetical protein